MLSQIRQKKKKEAVRRLSQGSGGTSASSHGPGQWPQRRKFSDQHRVQRQQPYEASQRPAKRSHISPLHQDAASSGDGETKPVKPDGTAGFSFGTAQTAISSQSNQFTHSATISSTSTFSNAPAFSSMFSSSAADANSSSSGSVVFGSTFGANTSTSGATLSLSLPNTSSNLFALPMSGPQILSSAFTTPQASIPTFGTGFHKSTTSTDLVSSTASTTSIGSLSKPGDSVKPPSSTTLTFGGFTNLNSSASSAKDLSLGSGFGDIGKLKPALPFGVEGQPHEAISSNLSSPAKPLFPIMSQSAAVFKTTKTQSAGIFGRTFATATKGHQAKENKEKITEKKIKILSTADLTALVIKEIPEMYHKNAWLKRFYSRFGEVTKVICSGSRNSATVVFKTHEAAEAAKKKGKILRPGLPPVEIFWKQQGRRRSATSESDQQSPVTNKAVVRSPEKSRKHLNQAIPTDEQRAKGIRGSGTVLKDIQDYLQTLAPSETAGEKLHVLEGIDKKLRQVFKRSSDISSAKAVAGTCKDMCPEKERYMREYQRRLSVFESIPGTGSIDENPQVNHSCAIKEYDRSAADKEEPLPHELRPIPVLKMTMDYLATNIMDLVEGREGEWFDFVWNRTRGIRKDITQQHLCDPDCADLVEKTARLRLRRVFPRKFYRVPSWVSFL